MRLRSLILMLALAAPAAVASAQHEEHGDAHAAQAEGHHPHGHGPVDAQAIFAAEDFWFALVNFLAVLAIFGWAVKKKVTPFLVERRRQVVESLEEARRLKSEAEAKHKEYTDRLAKLDSELAQIKSDMVKAGEAERDRIVAEAEKKASSLRHETEFLISQRMKELRETLTREAVEAAVATAGKVLAEKTTAEDQKRLAQSYLTAVSSASKGATSSRSGVVPTAGAVAEKKERLA
jgi:F-type H+-transporting ATPase subunit b